MVSERQVVANMERAMATLEGKIEFLIDYHANSAETHMKVFAPWRDRTGNARGSLAGIPSKHDWGYRIRLSGGMHYSRHLETARGGRYKIIYPTAELTAQALMADLNRLAFA